MSNPRKPLRSSLLIAALMFASRVLGFLRDMNTAAVLGMSASPIADAYFLAFRLPNLGRRLIEEGALGLSWIPAFSGRLAENRHEARRLFAAFLTRGAWWGMLVTVLGMSMAAGALFWIQTPETALETFAVSTLKLFLLMAPYFFFVLLTAQCAATLQASERFALASAIPLVFNIFWLVALFVISPLGVWLPFHVTFRPIFGFDPNRLSAFDRAAVLSCVITASGCAQFLIQRVYLFWILPKKNQDTRRARFDTPEKKSGRKGENQADFAQVDGVFRRMIPTALSLLFVQINTLGAALWAALWTGNAFFFLKISEENVFAEGTVTAIYYAERLYEFPLGLIGVAVSTAFYPVLVRLAREGDFAALAARLSEALEAIFLFSIPAAVGLFTLADPLATLLFERGDFTAEDAHRTAGLIRVFALGVPIFCLLPILIRTFFALGDYRLPFRAGLISTAVFLPAMVLFGFYTGPTALIAAVVLGACVQLAILAGALKKRLKISGNTVFGRWGKIWRVFAASAALFFAICAVWSLLARFFPDFYAQGSKTGQALVQTVSAIFAAVLVYFGTLRLLGEREIFRIFRKND